MGKIIRNNIEYSGSSNSAGNISYDNSASDLNSLTVQNAITELDGLVGEKLTQYSVMPTASAEYVGKVVQYVGTSGANYKKGCTYIAVSDGQSTPTYSWQAVTLSGSYTPQGSVSITPITSSIEGMATVGTLPTLTYDSSDESLTLDMGTLPTKATAVAAMTGANGSFSGTAATITVT